MLTLVVSLVAFALVWLALSALAFRQEFLVLLYWPRAVLIVLEREKDERYRQISPWAVPLGALRFAAWALSLVPGAVRRGVARVGSYLPSVVGSKA